MSIDKLMNSLSRLGIELWFEGERLRFRAPKGALGAEQRAELAARKTELVARLRAEAATQVETFPLSYSQRSLWFLHYQAPQSTAYHVAMCVRVRSVIDAGALRQALQALVDRHAILRTTYVVAQGAPCQRVAGAAETKLDLQDVANVDDATLRERVEADYRRPFDLELGPVLRTSLFSRAREDHVLLLMVHHIAADGWSLLLLFQELFKLYAEACGGPATSLPRPGLQYVEYAAWQEQMLAGPEGERLWSYWRDKLAAPRAGLDLPTDRDRPQAKTFRGASIPLELEPALTARLKQLARQEGTTLFVVLLASFQVLLSRLSGAGDLVVGTPTFARSKAEFLAVIGDFVNSVALRGHLRPDMPFLELIAQLRATVLEALDAQEYPLQLLVQKLQPERDSSRSPLFDTFFALQRFDQFREFEDLLVGVESGHSVEVGGVRLGSYPLDQQDGQFDLALQMVERGDALYAVLKYSTDLFEDDTIRRMAVNYKTLVEGLVGDPGAAIDAFPLFGANESAWFRRRHEARSADGSHTVKDVADLLVRLRALDVRLTLDGDKLGVSAPKGALTEALRAELSTRKEDIKAYLWQAAAEVDAVRSDLAIPRVSRDKDMPVSHTQQRLWFMKQMDPQSSVYNVPCAVRMTGALDTAALERTLGALLTRHESLRTHFLSVDGMPRCAVNPQATLPLERIDLAHFSGDVLGAEVMRQVSAIAARPFELAHSPLMRASLIRLAPDEHIFVFVLDHIVADGLSIGILLNDLQALYTEQVTGRPAHLPPLTVQYLDYAEWQRRWLAAGALDRQLAYWKVQLAGAPPALVLPTDRPRPRVQTSNGARTIVHFPPSLTAALTTLCRAEGVTLYMVLLSAFQVLLHRYTGEVDIVVGSAIANRNRPEVERVIGFFANNVVLRCDLSGDPTVRELLGRVREMALGVYDHQDMPFDVLVDALAPRRTLDHSPIFQVLFVVQSPMLTRLDLPGITCEVIEFPTRTARFDLAMDVFDVPDGLTVSLEYNTDLFDANSIDLLLGYYRMLLEGLAINAQARIGALPMLTVLEQRHLLDQLRGASLPPGVGTVHALFEAQAARTPDAEALSFEGQHLSYTELNARANQLARHLQALGVRSESLVGVWMERSAEMVVAMLGVLKAGGAYVPLDPAFPRERVDFMVSDAALEVVVTQSWVAGALTKAGVHAVTIDTEWPQIAMLADDDLKATSGPNSLAYVIYTSGSTGKPKGVQIEHASMVNFLRSMHREPGISAHDRFVAVTTLSFDIAGLEIHGPLTVGGVVVLASRATSLDGHRLADLLDESRATMLQATPATWRLLLESGWRGVPGLKMLCGGEALPHELADRLLALDGELWNMYGPTETTVWSTVSRVQDTTRTIAIGRPIAGTAVYVIEPSGLPAPVGVAGELCIGGAGVARGYRNRPELTAEKFVMLSVAGGVPERIYRTGDLARVRSDGQLEFLGRRDHQVKLRGFRIELGEIETVLATHLGVQQCVAAVREDAPGDQRLVAYIVSAAGTPFDADQARATLRAQLPEYMVPNMFVVLDALPLTPNNKVDRKALPAPQASTPRAGDMPDALMNPTQQRVASVWRELLRVDRVGLRDNFFDLGGHSLLLVKLQAELQRDFVVDLPLVELFQRTTVEAQAERLSSTTSDDGALQRARARAARQING